MIFQLNPIAGVILLIPIIFFIFTIGFLVFFLRRYLETKHKMFGYLTVFLLTYLLQNIFQIGEIVSNTRALIDFNFIMQETFNMLVLYSMVVLLEVFERDVSFSRRQSILTILVFATIGGMISTPKFIYDESLIFSTSFSWEEPTTYIQMIFYLIAGIWLISMLYRNFKTAWSKKQKRIIRWLWWGVFFGIFYPFIAYIGIMFFSAINTILLMTLLIITLIIRNIGILFIAVAFLQASKEPWLLQRHRAHFLIVYSKDGIQLFSKVFNKKLSDDKTLLLAGGFSAITSIFKEATETTGSIKSILLEDKELRIINKKNFICAILVDFSTQASEIAHEHFADEFETMFKEDLEDFNGEVSKFDVADIIVVKYFS
ncbi:MAG: hypothetical protein ACFFBP_05685 [Promethearchaeota archaeon]